MIAVFVAVMLSLNGGLAHWPAMHPAPRPLAVNLSKGTYR